MYTSSNHNAFILNDFNADLVIPFHNLISNHFVLNLYFNFSLNSLQFINLLYHVHTVFDYLVVKVIFSSKQIGKQNKCHIIIEWDRNDKEPLTIYYISDSYTLSPHVINSSFSI